jgi:hypothetical protein
MYIIANPPTPVVVATETPASEAASSTILKKEISIMSSLHTLYLQAVQGIGKDELCQSALDIFEVLSGILKTHITKKMNDMPSKTYKALEVKVGGRLSMAESKAWAKVIQVIYKTGICNNIVEYDSLMNKVTKFTIKKNFIRDKLKMKKEIIRQHKDTIHRHFNPDGSKVMKETPKMPHRNYVEKKAEQKAAKKQARYEQKQNMIKKKGKKLLAQFKCQEGCEEGECKCAINKSKGLKEYKDKVDGYYKDKREEMGIPNEEQKD